MCAWTRAHIHTPFRVSKPFGLLIVPKGLARPASPRSLPPQLAEWLQASPWRVTTSFLQLQCPCDSSHLGQEFMTLPSTPDPPSLFRNWIGISIIPQSAALNSPWTGVVQSPLSNTGMSSLCQWVCLLDLSPRPAAKFALVSMGEGEVQTCRSRKQANLLRC